MEQLTRKASRNKDTSKAAKAANKRCPRDSPILKANEAVIAIGTNVDKNAEQDEDNNGADFK